MGVDWGEYFGTEEPDEIVERLDDMCWEAANPYNYPKDKEKRIAKYLPPITLFLTRILNNIHDTTITRETTWTKTTKDKIDIVDCDKDKVYPEILVENDGVFALAKSETVEKNGYNIQLLIKAKEKVDGSRDYEEDEDTKYSYTIVYDEANDKVSPIIDNDNEYELNPINYYEPKPFDEDKVSIKYAITVLYKMIEVSFENGVTSNVDHYMYSMLRDISGIDENEDEGEDDCEHDIPYLPDEEIPF